MRFSHPYVWVLLCIGFVLLGVLGALWAGYEVVLRRWRAFRWPRERERRRAWSRVLARVDRAERVTELGDFILVLGIRPGADSATYRDAAEEVRWRRIVRLPSSAAPHVEKAETLPVLLAPSMPLTLALVLSPDASEAEQHARHVYIESGQLKWRLVPT